MGDEGQAQLISRFRGLHERGCFVIPNPWDPGSVRALEAFGFEALATTSAGFAFSRARPDASDSLDVDQVLDHVAEIVGSATLPVSADFQSGYADSADGVAHNVRRCVGTGVAGLSIEDTTGAGGPVRARRGRRARPRRSRRDRRDRHRRAADRARQSASWSATTTRSASRSDASPLTRTPAPTSCSRRVSAGPRTSERSCRPSSRSRSTS